MPILTEFLLPPNPKPRLCRCAAPCLVNKKAVRTLVKVSASRLYFPCFFEEFWEAEDLSLGGLTS